VRRRLFCGRSFALLLLGLGAACLLSMLATDAFAQGSPFGVARPDTSVAPMMGGPFAWIAERQAAFYRALNGAIRSAKTDGSALWLLIGISFAYGIFHAAGPGHGKAVISSYIVASGETLRRGLALSFAGAMLQAIVAILLVLTLTIALRATSMAMSRASFWLEAAGYAAMAALGAYLVLTKARSLWAATRTGGGAEMAAHCGPDCAHGPDPVSLAGPFDMRRAAAVVLAIGIRPCTGALVVLVFAIAQGLLWAGIAATFAMAVGTAATVAAIAALAVGAKVAALRFAAWSPRGGTVAVRGLELLAALVVLAFGLLLLGGLLASGASFGG
jgi:ABC-type nickel/cobalt efflux system permease component RcnA